LFQRQSQIRQRRGHQGSVIQRVDYAIRINRYPVDNKRFLDEVFVISVLIKVEVSVISRSRSLRLITLTGALIISDITKTEPYNCFSIHCVKENNNKHIIAPNTVYFRQAMFLRELDVALGNHALCAQPTDYSLIC